MVTLLFLLHTAVAAVSIAAGFALGSMAGTALPPLRMLGGFSSATRLYFAVTMLISITPLGATFAVQQGAGSFAFAIGLSFGFAALGLFLGLVPGNRSSILHWSQLLRRTLEPIDLAEARRACGRDGTVQRSASLCIWSDGVPVDDLRKIIEQSSAEFTALTGLQPGRKTPLRVLCFREESAVRRYLGIGTEAASFGGHYDSLIHKSIVTNGQWASRFPMRLRHLLGHEVTHHLTRDAFGRLPLPWLCEGLAGVVARAISPDDAEPTVRLRRLQADVRRGEFTADPRFLHTKNSWIHRQAAVGADVDRLASVSSFYAQSEEFLRWLQRRDAAALRAFFYQYRSAGKRGVDVAPLFGCSERELLEAFITDLLSCEHTLTSPTTAARDAIDDAWAGFAATAESNLVDRLRALWPITSSGYAWRAAALVDLLASGDGPCVRSAQRTLENLAAGAVLGRDAAIWRDWVAALPSEVRGPSPTLCDPRGSAGSSKSESGRAMGQ